jgi:hypothetical protein
MTPSPDGDYVLYTDHLAALAEKDEECRKNGITVEEQSDLPRLYRWQRESLSSFRNALGAKSNMEALEKITALTARIKELEATHDWYCGCGHWNGPNLSVCAQCGRTPTEGGSR